MALQIPTTSQQLAAVAPHLPVVLDDMKEILWALKYFRTFLANKDDAVADIENLTDRGHCGMYGTNIHANTLSQGDLQRWIYSHQL
jgi:hypothetical protein